MTCLWEARRRRSRRTGPPEAPEAPEAAEASDFKDVYRLLSRLKADCDYFLGAGERKEKHLWAGSAASQLDKMRELYALVPEKPEWLTEQELSDYAQRMASPPISRNRPLPPLLSGNCLTSISPW